QRHAALRLEEMAGYVEGSGCRHATIARHFGQALPACGGACDRCLGVEETAAPARPTAPTADQVPDLGSVILRTVLALPFGLGRTGLVKVLAGAVDSVVKADRCSLYGALKGFSQTSQGRAIDPLLEADLLRRHPDDEYRRLSVTAAGQEALQHGRVILANPHRAAPPRPPR